MKDVRPDKLDETDVYRRTSAKINEAAHLLLDNDCATLRRIRTLKDWHSADYTLHAAMQINGITRQQYDQAVSIFADWWEKTTGRSVIRAFTELQLSELTGMSEEERCKRIEESERFNELCNRRNDLIKRYQNGDRVDELFEEFEAVHLRIETSALIDYTDETCQQFHQILHDGAERKSRKKLS